MRNRLCLVLNSSYEPTRVVSWRTAVRLIFSKNNVEILENYPEQIHSINFSMDLPCVIKVPGTSHVHWSKNKRDFKSLKPNKKNIYIRDGGKCVYCDKELEMNESTLDHCIPKSKGGLRSWNNLVLACSDCNSKKSNKDHKNFKKPRKNEEQKIQHFVIEKALGHRVEKFPVSWLDYLGNS